ncbi:MAG: helix-turn-helix domain-containing protein [Caenibius sp.]
MANPTRFEALKAAVKKAGGQSGFARLLDVSQPTVWRWLNQSKQLPAEHVLATESATGVSRHDLRPDIYPVDLPPVSPRFNGVDRRATSVPFNRGDETQGEAA